MLWMMGHTVLERPTVTIAGAATVGAGFLLWWLLEGRARARG
jgi:hypothetical protein